MIFAVAEYLGIKNPAVQMLAIAFAATWIPAGVASASMIFSAAIHNQPENFLKHYYSNTFAFWITVLLGWVTFLFVAWLARVDRMRFAGLEVPGKRARRKAQERLGTQSL